MKRSLLLLLPLLAWGEGLGEMIDAAYRSDRLKSVEYAARAQAEAADAIWASTLPRIDLTAAAILTTNDPESPTLPEKLYQGGIKASWTLFDAGRTHALITQKKALATKAGHELSYQKESIALQVSQLYFQLLSLAEEKKLKEQKIAYLAKSLEKMTLYYNAGKVALDTLEQIRASYEQARFELENTAYATLQNRNTLTVLTGSVPGELNPAGYQEPGEAAHGTRYDLLALQESLKAAQAYADNADMAYWPRLMIEDSFTRSEYPGFSPASPFVVMPETQNKLTVAFSMPLFDFFGASHEAQAARYQALAVEAQTAEKERTLKLDEETARLGLEAARTRLEAAARYLEASRRSFEVAEKRFEAQMSDHVAYLNATTKHYEAQSLYAQAKNGYELEKARYYYTIGITLKEMIR